MRERRIAVVTTSYPRTSGDPSGHFVAAEVRALERAGSRVLVFTPGGEAFGWPGVMARIRERKRRALHLPSALVRWRSGLDAAARHEPFDRTIAHWALPSALPIALSLPPSRRGELEIVSHGADVRLLVGLPRPARIAAVKTLARAACRWRFPSASLLETLLCAVPRLGPAIERIAHITPPLLELPEIVRPPRRDFSKATYVSVARLIATKRVDRAIVHAAEKGARIVIVGDGPERARLESLARDLRADAHFVGTLSHPEALGWIADADALIHASAAEGLSTVVREAEALGTPVVILS